MIVKMSRLRLIGLKQDYDDVINILTESKQFEFKSAPFAVPLGETEIEAVKIQQSQIAFAIDYLVKLNDEAAALQKKIKKGKANYSLSYIPFKKENVRKLISFDSFEVVEKSQEQLFEVVETIKNLSFKQTEINSRIAEIKAKKREYAPYAGLPFSFEAVRSTKETTSALYFTTKKKPVLELGETDIYHLYNVEGGIVAWVTCLNHNVENVDATMLKCGFSRMNYKSGRIKELLFDCDKKIEELNNENFKLMLKGLELEKFSLDLMIFYDLLAIKLQQKFAYNGSLTTEYTFILDGWVPEETGERIVKRIEDNYRVCCSLTPAKANDDPPTLIVNNKLVEPFENITNMYTVPAYTEKDPNPHMAFWYFILFGVMCGDVVYGLMLTISCLLLLKIKRFEKGTKSMIKMFAICGISSALWGVAFDSYLGYGIGFGWFVPMDRPMLLLGLSLVLGILQIAYGYILGVIRCIREKNITGALFDMGFMLMVIVAIVCLTANIFVGIFTEGVFDMSGQFLPQNISSALSSAGLIILLIAIIGIFLTAGRASKSIMGKLGNGLYGVYGLVNLVSDILSYCRLFGLGLAGGAIAYAFNTLMETIFFAGGSIPGFIIGAILSLVLHVFNLAISLLGAYVHNARLQMLEFYGKFLIGDGRDFSYIGQRTKYVRY